MGSRRGMLAGLMGLGFSVLLVRAAKADPVSYTYDVFGRVTSVTYPNGTVTTYTYDDAGNRTGRSNGATPPPPPPPPPLAASASPETLAGTGSEGAPPATAVATGGTAPYVYLWQRLSGSTNIEAGDPTAASTEFGWDGPLSGPPRLSSWRCRVTDATSTIAYTNTIRVTINPSA
jgi:YD repeat-containing protein